jgi:hypothetical protein
MLNEGGCRWEHAVVVVIASGKLEGADQRERVPIRCKGRPRTLKRGHIIKVVTNARRGRFSKRGGGFQERIIKKNVQEGIKQTQRTAAQ